VKHSHAGRCLVAVSLLIVSLVAVSRADNWPQWRGPNNDGISKEKNLPTEWSETKNIVWKLKLPGMGSATPVVWGDLIFVTSDDTKDVFLQCISTKGEEVWKKKFGESNGKKYHGDSNNASPSPSTDGKNVWCFSGNGDLACFDFGGKEIWKINTQDRYGKVKFQWGGIHSSPVLYEDRLYLQLLNGNGQNVVALNKATGEEVWKIERKSDGRGECLEVYASPFIWQNGKDAYLVVHGNDYATAHRLKDGSEIWRVGDLNSKSNYNSTYRFVSSPVMTPDLIVVPTAKGGAVVAVKPNATGTFGTGSDNEIWRLKRGTPDVCIPLVEDGLVYLDNDATVTCLDAKTGKEYYSEKIHGGIYRGSPLYADGKIYYSCQDGTVTVVKAGPKFEVLAVNKLSDKINASPVVANGRIYIRGWDNLYAISADGK
jgi:outer membrane protein assembly factor BamB